MTCREKLKIEHPEKISDTYGGGCYGCPSEYNYLPDLKDCFDEEEKCSMCEKCWNREIPDNEKVKKDIQQFDIHELIDDAIKKKDRSVTIFICDDSINAYVSPLDTNEKNTWKFVDGSSNVVCSNCGRVSDQGYPYCHWCGEELVYDSDYIRNRLESEYKRKTKLKKFMKDEKK